MRLTRRLLFLCGVAFFVVLLRNLGTEPIVAAFSQLSWRLLVVVVFPFAVVTLCDTLGWRFAFAEDTVPFWTLVRTRMAGESFNATTPTASVGGEAVKTVLLRDHVDVHSSLPSVILAKTTITIAQVAFLGFGVVVCLGTAHAGSPLHWTMIAMLAVETLAVAGFVAVQAGGLLGRASHLIAWTGLVKSAAELGRLDSAVAGFYRQHRMRLGLSTGWHFLGWAWSALETYMIMAFLGLPVTLTDAAIIEAFGTGVRFASFMIPAHMGALEGGHVASFVALGFEASAGLSFSIVRRVREAVWVGIGFLFMIQRRAAPAALPAAPDA